MFILAYVCNKQSVQWNMYAACFSAPKAIQLFPLSVLPSKPTAQDLHISHTNIRVHEWERSAAVRSYFLKNSWVAFYIFSKFHSDSSLSKFSFVFIQEILARLNFKNIGSNFYYLPCYIASSSVKLPLIFFSWPFQISVNELKGHNRIFYLILKCHKL